MDSNLGCLSLKRKGLWWPLLLDRALQVHAILNRRVKFVALSPPQWGICTPLNMERQNHSIEKDENHFPEPLFLGSM